MEDRFNIPIEWPEPPHIEVDPSLRTIAHDVPAKEAIDAPVPEVRAATEERFANFDLARVTHVVIQLTVSQQTQLFRHVGYQDDWNHPAPFWHFLGRMAAKGLFGDDDDDDQTELDEFNFVALGRREFVAFTTPMWLPAGGAESEKAATAPEAELPPLNVIEVKFKKPQPGQPVDMNWAPGKAVFVDTIRDWNKRAGKPRNPDDYVEYPHPSKAAAGSGTSQGE